MSGTIGHWQGRLEAELRSRQSAFFNRVVVVEEAEPTQDAALERSAGEPGLVLVASRQTRGRGRLGRAWIQRDGLGLAATFVLSADAFPADRLSIAAGVAAAEAVGGFVGDGAPVGL